MRYLSHWLQDGKAAAEKSKGKVTTQKSTKVFFLSTSNLKFKFPAKMSADAATAAAARRGENVVIKFNLSVVSFRKLEKKFNLCRESKSCRFHIYRFLNAKVAPLSVTEFIIIFL